MRESGFSGKLTGKNRLSGKGVWPSLKYRLPLVVAFLREPPHALDHRGVWHRIHRHCVLEKAVEEFAAMARGSSVEPERELVEIVVEMLTADRTLMSAEEPASGEGRGRSAARW